MGFTTSTTTTSPHSIELTSELVAQTREAAADEPLIQVRPFLDTDGIQAGPRFLRGLHTTPARTFRRRGAPVYAAEIWFEDGQLQFYLRAPDQQDAIALVNAHYPNSETQTVDDSGFPDIIPGQHVAGGHLQLKQDTAFPIKHLDSRPPLDDDPYRTLLSRLVGADEETTILQIVFMPVTQTWTRRGLLGRSGHGDVTRLAHSRRQGTVEGYLDPQVVQSKRDTQAADDIAAQLGHPAFATTIRVLSIAPDGPTAAHRLQRITDAVRVFDHDHTSQGFEPRYASSSHLPAVLEAAGMRTLTPRSWLKRTLWGRANVLTVNELAGLVHFPNEDIENSDIDWSRLAAGVGVPADSQSYSVSSFQADRSHFSKNAQTSRTNHDRLSTDVRATDGSRPSRDSENRQDRTGLGGKDGA
ncbi:hypothetical protein [Halorussus halophilus]|uniref:hypothetical protein n=1 Tax=Halorussus halophilus TaxID=2650975 RepID=UPI0013010048|nr:hypothetical protein [Halorussus halophilus]